MAADGARRPRREKKATPRMTCLSCRAMNAATARFCDQCGVRLPSSIPEGSIEVLGPGDRRIVTAIFADLVGYSRMVAELDPEEVRRRVDEALGALAAAVDRYGGMLEKFIGDAVFAVFGAPRAHDDDAVRAALCALAMRESLARLNARDIGAPLKLRIGLATGEVVAAPRDVAGQRAIALTGEAVMTAARLQQFADPDEIVVDDATVAAGRYRLEVSPRGEHLLRGRLRPMAVHRLLGVRPARFVAARAGELVGREGERALLREALDAVARTGRGSGILLVGEPGMGKTRLAADLEADARAAGFAWTWSENVSYRTGEPYGHARLFVERVADELGTDPGTLARLFLLGGDVPPDRARRMAGAVAAMARDAAFSGWEAEMQLAPSDPREVAVALMEASDTFNRRLIELHGPRVSVVDDLHWQDVSSRPLTEQLIRILPEIPLLLVLTMRPGALPAWASLAHIRVVELHGLDARETGRLASAVAGAEVSLSDARSLHERTDGNPLFIGELIRALLAERPGSIRDGRLSLEDLGRTHTVPVTLRALIGARIDALADDARAALQVASVVGISFTDELVAELVGRPLATDVYDRLAAAALVVARGDTGAWRFGHPLIRDAAYAGILASRRRTLHARVADRLESLDPPAPAGAVALHRAAAGDRERAVPLLLRAADEAIALAAADEAAELWLNAADLLGNDPRAAELRDRALRARRAVDEPAGSAD